MNYLCRICCGFRALFCSVVLFALSAGELRYDVKRLDREPPETVKLSTFSFTAYVLGDRIFFILEFSDEFERRSHRSWVWDHLEQHYREGDDLEAAFSMMIESEFAKFADLWFWRSFISDPAGIAEDMHLFGYGGRTAEHGVLIRRDAGELCWETRYFDEFVGEKLPRFQHKKATGSSADVFARGVWADGRWRVTLSRKLYTGQGDDLAFAAGRSYSISLLKGLPGTSPVEDRILLLIP